MVSKYQRTSPTHSSKNKASEAVCDENHGPCMSLLILSSDFRIILGIHLWLFNRTQGLHELISISLDGREISSRKLGLVTVGDYSARWEIFW